MPQKTPIAGIVDNILVFVVLGFFKFWGEIVPRRHKDQRAAIAAPVLPPSVGVK